MRIKWMMIVFSLVVLSTNLKSQTYFLEQDTRVNSLLNLHKEINSQDSLVSGYRVQIFFESGNFSKDSAVKTAEEFNMSFPEIRYYLSFSEPYYRIRVGDFRTLIEAKGFLAELIHIYPSAFEVKEMVYFPPLSD